LHAVGALLDDPPAHPKRFPCGFMFQLNLQ
jgi:hypothetical protein